MIDEEAILTYNIGAIYTLFKIKFDDMARTKDDEGSKIDPFVNRDDYNKVRFGFTIKFELEDYIKGRFREKPKSGTIVIWKNEYSLKDFRTEIEKREKVMRNSLLNYYSQDKDIIS